VKPPDDRPTLDDDALRRRVDELLEAAENALAQQSREHCDGRGIACYVDRFCAPAAQRQA